MGELIPFIAIIISVLTFILSILKTSKDYKDRDYENKETKIKRLIDELRNCQDEKLALLERILKSNSK